MLEGQILGDAEDSSDQRGWADELANAGCTVLWMIEPEGNNAPMAPYRYIHSKVAVRDGDSVWIGSGNWKQGAGDCDWLGAGSWDRVARYWYQQLATGSW